MATPTAVADLSNKMSSLSTSSNSRQRTLAPRKGSLDIGYYTCSYFDGEHVRNLRSIYAPLTAGSKVPDRQQATFEISFKGQRYLVGQGAASLRQARPFSNEDKLSEHIVKLAVFALIEDERVDLIVSHYDSDNARRPLETLLCDGPLLYEKDGIGRRLTIHNLSVVDEGLGAWQMAKSADMTLENGLAGVIDIGCDTYIVSIYDPQGRRIAHEAYPQQGVKSLAIELTQDKRLIDAVSGACNRQKPSSARVLDGLARDNCYGETAVTWADYLDEYLNPWFNSIVDRIKTDFSSQLPDITRFVLTGGGAHLVKHRVAPIPLFYTLPNPHIANAVGAYFL